MKYVLALDPSGNYYEGKGTTGWCIARDGFIYDAGQIYSAESASQMAYWDKVISLLKNANLKLTKDDTLVIVCEDYRLYASKSESQINSNLETPQLIGVIKYWCYKHDIPCVLQMAAEVKIRWSDKVLKENGILNYRSRKYYCGKVLIEHHSKDALRHCLHYMTFKDAMRKPLPKFEMNERSYY